MKFQVLFSLKNDKISFRMLSTASLLSALRVKKFFDFVYKGESMSNQPNLFPVEIRLFFFDVIAL